MKRYKMVSFAAGFALALAMAPGLWADHHEKAEASPRRMVIHTDHVVPSMVEAYEKKGKAWVAAFKEAGMTGPEWSWYTSSSADFVYVTAFPFGAMADLDRQEERQAAIREALGDEKFAQLNEPNGAVVRHVNEIARFRPDLSYQPTKPAVGEAVKFMRVGVHKVKPGMEQRFEAVMAKVAAAFAKAEHGLGFETFELEYGESGYVVTAVADDAAQFYGMPSTGEALVKGVGPEQTQMLYAEWRECLTGYDTSDWTVRADLSYTGSAAAASDSER